MAARVERIKSRRGNAEDKSMRLHCEQKHFSKRLNGHLAARAEGVRKLRTSVEEAENMIAKHQSRGDPVNDSFLELVKKCRKTVDEIPKE